MKPVKAIDLVWKAQPMISTLRTVMAGLAAQSGSSGPQDTLVEHCDEWLRDANEILSRGRK